MILPLIYFRSRYADPLPHPTVAATGATAALGAVFRSGARNLLRSTLMAAARATSRTVSRRAVRAVLRTVVEVLLPRAGRASAAEGKALAGLPAAGVGFAALVVSFLLVAVHVEEDVRAALLGGQPVLLMAVVAALPLLVYLGLLRLGAHLTGCTVRIVTSADGLALQTYFTLAGSFMPLTTDAEVVGSPQQRGQCALLVTLGLLGMHYLLGGLASLSGLSLLDHLGGFVLLYAFVFSFPLKPLDGGHIYEWSRGIWFAAWAVVVLSFLSNLPDVLYDVL